MHGADVVPSGTFLTSDQRYVIIGGNGESWLDGGVESTLGREREQASMVLRHCAGLVRLLGAQGTRLVVVCV